MTFGDALFAFDGAVPVGLADEYKTIINPPRDRLISAGDRVIVVAADDDSYVYRAPFYCCCVFVFVYSLWYCG